MMRRRRKRQPAAHLLLATALLLPGVAGCGGQDDPGSAPCGSWSLVIGRDSLTMAQGDSTTLTPELRCGGTADAAASFTYTSQDPSIASVTPGGIVIAVGRGRTTLAVQSGEFAESLPVRSYGHPTGVLEVTVPLADRPFGVAVSSTGVVYVTRYDAMNLASFTLPNLSPLVSPIVPVSARDVGFNPTGDTAYVVNYDQKQITVVDVARHATVGAIPLSPTGRPLSLLVHPDGTSLFATTDNDVLFKVDLPTRLVTGEVGIWSSLAGSGPTGLALLRAGTEVTVASHSAQVSIYPVAAPALVDTMTLPGFSVSPEDVTAAWNSDTLFLAASPPGGLYVMDRASGVYIGAIMLPIAPFTAEFSPDQRKIFAAGANQLCIVDRATLTVDSCLFLGTELRHVAFDQYGKFVVVADEAGFVFLLR